MELLDSFVSDWPDAESPDSAMPSDRLLCFPTEELHPSENMHGKHDPQLQLNTWAVAFLFQDPISFAYMNS